MNFNQEKTPLFDAIMEYIDLSPAYFCIPGHRFEKGINKRWTDVVGENIFKFDLTETPWLDDLHNPEGAIREAEILAQEVFGAQRSFFLINGTTCGNQAMVISTASENQKLIVPRNAHKSVLMGLIISGATPLYIMPKLSKEWGVQGGIEVENLKQMLDSNPECKGVLVVSPTYYGICSNLKELAQVCHNKKIPLMVDEAHGAHLYFSDELPHGALTQGADMCSQSIHKVTGSLTQSSMLHVNSNYVDISKIKSNLQLVQSTSPSYLLMTSLDVARHELAIRGKELIGHAVKLAKFARDQINRIEGFTCIDESIVGQHEIYALDKTRLTFSAKKLRLTGFELKSILFEEFSIDLELADYLNVLAIITFANTEEDVQKLLEALKIISHRHKKGLELINETYIPDLPPYVLSPRQAYFSEKVSIPWKEARGQVAGEMIAPYPPGIPVIYPGELVTDEIWEYLEEYRRKERHLHGPSDPRLNTFAVIRR